MPDCPNCGSPTKRGRRSLFRRLVSQAVFVCESCGLKMAVGRPYLSIFQGYAECPRCCTRKLVRLNSRDHVDVMSANPFRRLLGLFGAPLYHCIYCRYQFRDWRKREADARRAPVLKTR